MVVVDDACLVKPRRPPDVLFSWRPLCLCGTLFKLYDRLLWTAAATNLVEFALQLFGFRPGRQGMGITEAARCTMRKATEWREPLNVASLDEAKAFDQIEPCAVEHDMLSHGAPAWAVAAVVRELLDQTEWPLVGGIESDGPVQLENGAQRGASGTPILWNVAAGAITRPLVEEWADAPCTEWCHEIRDWPILWYAENAYVSTDNMATLQKRCRTQTRRMAVVFRLATTPWTSCITKTNNALSPWLTAGPSQAACSSKYWE